MGNYSARYIKNEVEAVGVGDPEYPYLLKQIDKPPVKIFYHGRLPAKDESCVAVVGSRHCSGRAKVIIDNWVPELVKAGFVIISGLAIGIDSLVHEACLACGGRAVAVLPTGLDPIYPRRNKYLAEEIVSKGGCLISEYPSGTAVDRGRFLWRNRIVSGLSLGVLVVEASQRSGSLNTAGWAAEQGREVWCVSCKKGELNSEGVLGLIEDGACEVHSVAELLETFKSPNPFFMTVSSLAPAASD